MLSHGHVTTRTVARAQRVQQRLSAEIYRTKHAGHTLQHNISPSPKCPACDALPVSLTVRLLQQ